MISKNDRKAKTLFTGIRKKTVEDNSVNLPIIRHNISLVLQYSKVIPFQWSTTGFRCFYCCKPMRDCEALKCHTLKKHVDVNLSEFIPKKIITKDVPVKIDVSNISCIKCDEEFADIDKLIDHIKVVHEENYDLEVEKCFLPFILDKNVFGCAICDEKFDNFKTMVSHMLKAHMYHSVICQECGRSFTNNGKLTQHVIHAHRDHKCNLCPKLFNSAYKLEKHKERIHGRVKNYNCELCSEVFENDYQLKVHMGTVHNVEKYRMKCKLCPKICSTKGALSIHVQYVHAESTYECDQCDYKTSVKWMLTLHKRKHSTAREYVCSVCDKMFKRSNNLRAHMKVHSGVIGRVCRACRKGFLGPGALAEHKMEMHYYNAYN